MSKHSCCNINLTNFTAVVKHRRIVHEVCQTPIENPHEQATLTLTKNESEPLEKTCDAYINSTEGRKRSTQVKARIFSIFRVFNITLDSDLKVFNLKSIR